VSKKLSIAALLFAWLCANGALLDTAQIVAWVRMFTGYAQTMPVTAALRETFDPAKPCEMCVGIAAAKEELAEKNPPAKEELASGKLVLALDAPVKFRLSPPACDWPATLACAAPNRREPVPVPPPRV
jgi:hypothetical protein